MKVLILFAILAIAVATTVPFVDIKEELKDAECIRNSYTKICVRGFLSMGKVDPYVVKSLAAADKAGIEADVYMIPCFYCNDPEKQALTMMTALKDSKFKMLWVTVEGTWSSDLARNRQFLVNLTMSLEKNGAKNLGIFTFQPTWERIFGKDYSDFSNKPLWYIRWNENPNDNDFVPFGGWKKPAAKQYDTENEECAMTVDNDSSFT